MPPKKYDQETIDQIVKIKDSGGSWGEVQEAFPQIPLNSLKTLFRRDKAKDRVKSEAETMKPGTVHRNEQPNELTISGKVPGIRTLEQLLDHCEVDLDVWDVVRHEIRTWPGWRADKQVDLEWDEGRATGSVKDSGRIYQEQLLYIKAQMVRKKPIPMYPHVQPVQMDVGGYREWDAKEKWTKAEGGALRTLLVSDAHVGYTRNLRTNVLTPFHDRQALAASVEIIRQTRPHEVIIMGDKLDLPEWTDSFARSPEVYTLTQPALMETRWWLWQYRLAAPNAVIVWIGGNHEARIDKMIARHLPAAYALASVSNLNLELFSVPSLLDLASLGITYIDDYPTGSYWVNDTLEVEHGSRSSKISGGSAKAVIGDRMTSVAFGHVHRPELVTQVRYTGAGPEVVKSFCPGCLCRIDGVVPGHDPRYQDWAQGVALVSSFSTGHWSVNLIGIEDGAAVVGDKLITPAEDLTCRIQDAMPGWKLT